VVLGDEHLTFLELRISDTCILHFLVQFVLPFSSPLCMLLGIEDIPHLSNLGGFFQWGRILLYISQNNIENKKSVENI